MLQELQEWTPWLNMAVACHVEPESTSPESKLEAAVATAPVLRKAARGASNPVVPDPRPVEKDQIHDDCVTMDSTYNLKPLQI